MAAWTTAELNSIAAAEEIRIAPQRRDGTLADHVVWPELLARARGRSARSEQGLACIVGLHLIDAWEARRLA